jgi:hypothetical protein
LFITCNKKFLKVGFTSAMELQERGAVIRGRNHGNTRKTYNYRRANPQR